MATPYSGGCVCGATRYRLTAEPLTLYACRHLLARAGGAHLDAQRAPWFRFPEGVPTYEKQPADMRELARLWQSRRRR